MNKLQNSCTIWTVFDEPRTVLKEYSHWKLLLQNRNNTLGNCVAITKRHIERFSDITPEEMTEFGKVVSGVEHALKHAFQYDKINYLMLMMVDKHAHFHIIPRYASPRIFAGIIWNDADLPRLQVHKIRQFCPKFWSKFAWNCKNISPTDAAPWQK